MPALFLLIDAKEVVLAFIPHCQKGRSEADVASKKEERRYRSAPSLTLLSWK